MSEVKRWIRVVRCQDIPVREGRAVTIGDREVAVFNLGDRFLAVDNQCPHRGGPLADGIVCGTTVVCPLHSWKFNLDTGLGANSPSSSTCVTSFPTRVEHGIVFLEVSVTPVQTEDRAEVLPELLNVLDITPSTSSEAC